MEYKFAICVATANAEEPHPGQKGNRRGFAPSRAFGLPNPGALPPDQRGMRVQFDTNPYVCDTAAAPQNAATAGICNTLYPKTSGAAASARHASRDTWAATAAAGPARAVTVRKGMETSRRDMAPDPARRVPCRSKTSDAPYHTMTGHAAYGGRPPRAATPAATPAATK